MRQHETQYSFGCIKILGRIVVEGYLQGKNEASLQVFT